MKFAIKGNIVFTKTSEKLEILENHFVVWEKEKCLGVFENFDGDFIDHTGKIVMPGLCDIHVHAPQYTFRGVGTDLELMEWLETYTFKEERKYEDEEYAKKAYGIFVKDMKNSGTTRVCAFGTIHNKATNILMDLLEENGLSGYVGKVSMDRNSPDFLTEKNAEENLLEFLENQNRKNVKPILTPRFIPTCSDELMTKIGEIQKENNIPAQSHLSENDKEIAMVRELCGKEYGEAYDSFGLFGTNGKTIMAHCVHSSEEEMELMHKNGVFVAHCPSSNANLASGIAPAKVYLDKGINMGLGSDVAGGEMISMFAVMKEVLKTSRLRTAVVDKSVPPLSVSETIYLATKGGGKFFGNVGSFEKDYEFDAIVIDDSSFETPLNLSVEDRVERMIYLATEQNVVESYCKGKKIK